MSPETRTTKTICSKCRLHSLLPTDQSDLWVEVRKTKQGCPEINNDLHKWWCYAVKIGELGFRKAMQEHDPIPEKCVLRLEHILNNQEPQ